MVKILFSVSPQLFCRALPTTGSNSLLPFTFTLYTDMQNYTPFFSNAVFSTFTFFPDKQDFPPLWLISSLFSEFPTVHQYLGKGLPK